MNGIRESLSRMHGRWKVRGFLALGLAALALLALPSVWRSPPVVERRAAASLKRAQAHRRRKEFAEARGAFRQALLLQPADAEARSELAALELDLGDRDVAFLELETLTELHPEIPEGWVALADLLVKGGLLLAPEGALDRAITEAPGRADARLLRAEIRLRMGRYHGARLDAEAAEKGSLEPGARQRLALVRDGLASKEARPAPVSHPRALAEARMNGERPGSLAREHWAGRLAQMRQALDAALRQRDWALGERIVTAAQDGYAGTSFAPFLAGVLALAQGKTEQAEEEFLRALQAAPRSPVVAAALAKTWSRMKGAGFAGEQLMRLVEKDPGFTQASDLAARAFVDGRDPLQAEAALRRAIALRPDSSRPYQNLADHYQEIDRTADALAVCQQGLERLPEDDELKMRLAQLSAAAGKANDAIAIYQKLLARRPDLDLAEYRLAALVASQDDDQAPLRSKAIFGDLQQDAPSDPALLDTLGWLHYREGLIDRARELLLASVQASPDEPEAHFHLAAVYLRGRQARLARAELQAAVDSPRPFSSRREALRLLRETQPPEGTGRSGPRRR